VAAGRIRVTDGNGAAADVDLTSAKTLGDVITAINTSGLAVAARLNDTGDGLLVEKLGGSGGVAIAEAGTTTAADLRLLGSNDTSIDGAFRYTATLDADDTLNDVVAKLGSSGAPLTASVFSDGGGLNPFHLLITSSRAGQNGRLLIDTGSTSLALGTLVAGADALLEVGASGQGMLVRSASNTFANVLPGLSIDVLGTSTDPISVTVAQDNAPLAAALRQFVNNFNAAARRIAEVTAFDPETLTRGVLQGDDQALQAQSALFGLLARQFGPAGGAVRQLSQVGISLVKGELTLDEARLESALTTNAEAVRAFFETNQSGMADQLDSVLDALTDASGGSIGQRNRVLDDTVEEMETRLEFLDARVEDKRLRLLQQFSDLEQALAQVQSQQTALTQLQQIAASYSRTRSS
jgi:flagellar hook-associated protein 2